MRHKVATSLIVLVVLLVIAVAAFDWNWLRAPIEHYVYRRTHRTLTIGSIDVRWSLTPTVRVDDIAFQNAPWAEGPYVVQAKHVDFNLSLAELWHGRILIPRLAFSGARASLEMTADGRKNWTLTQPNEKSRSVLKILTIAAADSEVTFIDQKSDFRFTVRDAPRQQPEGVQSDDPRLVMRLQFKGVYRGAPFYGEALSGNVLSFQESNQPFPLKGHLDAGRTRLDVEGTVADLLKVSAIDANVHIAGATLANLYPFLLLPLPASPPYDFTGHLTFKGKTYRYGSFHGHVGSTDIAGDATYESRDPRPFLQADLKSHLTDLADLGPLVGVQTQSGTGAPPPGPALQERETAAQAEHAANRNRTGSASNERVLPSGPIDTAKLSKIDADVSFKAEHLKAPPRYAVDSIDVRLKLKDALMTIDPIDLGFAGGHLTGSIVLNGQRTPTAAQLTVAARGLDLGRLIPPRPGLSPSGGRIAGRLSLDGAGNSVASMLGDANGSVGMALAGGQVSDLADALAELNGGRVLEIFATGDKPIRVHCGGVALKVANGVATTQEFVLGTDNTEYDAQGTINFKNETLNLTIAAKAKSPGILSFNSPLKISGTFRHPRFGIDKTALAEHVGGAIALGILNPLAALIPLLETGPGNNLDCSRVLGTAESAEKRSATPLPTRPEHPVAQHK